MGRLVLRGLSVALLLVTAPAPASAQVDLDRAARAHFESGTAYFETGDYDSALREFERAYELSHRPALLYNVYLANERLNRLATAADALGRYLDAAPDDPRHATLALRLQNLRRRIAEQSAPPPVTPPPVTPPPVTPPPVTPPPVTPPAVTPRPVVRPAVTPRPVAPAPRALRVTRASVRQPASSSSPVAAIVAFGVGGVGLVTLGVSGALVLDEDASLASSCGIDVMRTCTEDQLSALREMQIVADIGLGVAVVGAAVGAVLLLTADGDDEPRPTARVTPWLGPTIAGLAATGAL